METLNFFRINSVKIIIKMKFTFGSFELRIINKDTVFKFHFLI